MPQSETLNEEDVAEYPIVPRRESPELITPANLPSMLAEVVERSDLLGVDNDTPVHDVVHDPLISYTKADNLGYDWRGTTTSAAIKEMMVLGFRTHMKKPAYHSSAGEQQIRTWWAAEHPDCREPPVGYSLRVRFHSNLEKHSAWKFDPDHRSEVFVTSIQVSSSSVNLHHGCTDGVFVDVPPKCSEMQQRIGRVYRLR